MSEASAILHELIKEDRIAQEQAQKKKTTIPRRRKSSGDGKSFISTSSIS